MLEITGLGGINDVAGANPTRLVSRATICDISRRFRKLSPSQWSWPIFDWGMVTKASPFVHSEADFDMFFNFMISDTEPDFHPSDSGVVSNFSDIRVL